MAFSTPTDALDPEKGALEIDLRRDLPFEAHLFVPPDDETPPGWQQLLEQGTTAPLDLPPNITNGAVLFIRTQAGGERWLVFTFGKGRFLLRRHWIERRFGLRTALNLAYPRGELFDGELPSRLKTVDAKTIEDVTYDTRRRASKSVPLENFGLNVRRDLMAAVEAYPADADTWGRSIIGGNPLRIRKGLAFDDFGILADKIVETWAKDDFLERFSFIENIQPVEDELVDQLEIAVIDALQTENFGGFELAIPEGIDRDDIAGYRLPQERGTSHRPELRIEDYMRRLGDETLTPDRLRRDPIYSIDINDQPHKEASLFECLTGQLIHDDKTYVLSDGVFYQVNRNYLLELDSDLQAIPLFGGEPLPVCPNSHRKEADYNELACDRNGLLLLDKRLVPASGRSKDVEVCDLLGRSGEFFHVKMKLRSSTLSHLFSQGSVSADLLARSPGFRGEVKALIGQIEGERLSEPGFAPGYCPQLKTDSFRANSFEVVYVIVAKWQGRTLSSGLPFFSKVNLRQRIEDLRAMDFRVSCALVETE